MQASPTEYKRQKRVCQAQKVLENIDNSGHNEKSNLRIIRVEEPQLKVSENIYNKIIDDFPNLNKELATNIQEAYRTTK